MVQQRLLGGKYHQDAIVNIYDTDPQNRFKVFNTDIKKITQNKKGKDKNKANLFACDAIVYFGPKDDDGNNVSTVFGDLILDKIDGKTEHKGLAVFLDDLFHNTINREEIVVNERLADQLLLFMALADGKSEIVMGETQHYSKHFPTQVELLKNMIPGVEITVTEKRSGGGGATAESYVYNHVQVQGIGFKG